MKTCTKCKKELPLDSYDTDRNGKNGKILKARCRSCVEEGRLARWDSLSDEEKLKRREKARRGKRARLYGLSTEDLSAIEGVRSCAICYGEAEAIDHCHETGRVRGVLCNACNQTLGKMHDSPALLRRAAEYLEKTGEPGRYGH